MKKQLLTKAIALLAMLAAATGVKAQSTTIASWDKGTINGGMWTSIGNAFWLDASKDNAQVTQKYNSNKTTVNVITFTSSIGYSAGEFNHAIKLEGDFKVGDVVTFQPFTNMSTGDFTGGSKYANIVIKDAANTELFTTGGTATEKTVTDGHEEAGDPQEFSYTLTADQSVLYFGRSGNTRINVIKIVVERPQTSVDVTIGETTYATFGNNSGVTLSLPTGLKAYGVSSVSDGSVVFAEYNVIPAGVGVILKADVAGDYTLERTETASTYEGDNLMVAVTADMTVPATEGGMVNYIFANKEQGVGFYKSSGEGTITAGKAYLSIVDESADNRSWSFTTWSDASVSDLEAERTKDTPDIWKQGAASGECYRYHNVAALDNAALTANGNVITETEGLLFTSAGDRLGIDNRNAAGRIYFGNGQTSVIIPDLKPNHTVTINARTSNGSYAGYMVCDDETNVEMIGGDTESTAQQDCVFEIKAAGTYAFHGNRSVNIASITIAPKEGNGGSEARLFIGIDAEGTTTGISDASRLNRNEEMRNDNIVCNLNGQRLRVAQPKGGIYIKNGKKVIIK